MRHPLLITWCLLWISVKVIAFDHLTTHDSVALEAWKIAGCSNYANVFYSTTGKYQNFGGSLTTTTAANDGDVNTTVNLTAFPARIELTFTSLRDITTLYWKCPPSCSPAYTPGKVKIESSQDGSAWTTLVPEYDPAYGTRSFVHEFPATNILAIALVVTESTLPGVLLTQIGEIELYNESEKPASTSIYDPPWYDTNYIYRVRISDSNLVQTAGTVCRRFTDFTGMSQLFGQITPATNALIVQEVGTPFMTHRRIGSQFIPDSRFNAVTEATGITMWRFEDDPGTTNAWWEYFSAQPFTAPVPALPFSVSVSGQQADITLTNALQEMMVLDYLGQTVTNTTSQSVTLYGLDPISRYCIAAKWNGNWTNGWFKVSSGTTITGLVSMPLYNYRRSSNIVATLTLGNTSGSTYTGSLVSRIMDSTSSVASQNSAIGISSHSTTNITVTFPSSQLASKSYRLETRVLTGSAVEWASLASVEIVKTNTPYIPFGIYGLPSTTRIQSIRYLDEANRLNITLDNGHYTGRGYNYDMSAAFGVEQAPTASSQLWPYGAPAGLPFTNRLSYDGSSSTLPCFLDPTTRNWALTNSLRTYQVMQAYPSFNNRIGMHDDVWMDQISGGSTHLACYCPLCTNAFYVATGSLPPAVADITWSSPIVDGNDLWLKWNRFRSRDCYADFTKALSDGKSNTYPNIKLGTFLVKNVQPDVALYSYFTQTPCGAVSCYDYPRSTAGTFDYNALYMRDEAIMGNRTKESWMLNWIGGISGESWNGTASPGEVRCQFWNMLAAGNRVISYFYYGDPGTASCIEGSTGLQEMQTVGATVKRIGPMFLAASQKTNEVAVLCSSTAFWGSLLTSLSEWNTVRTSLRNAYFACLNTNCPAGILAEEELINRETNGLKVIIVPNYSYISLACSNALAGFSSSGGTVLVNDNVPFTIAGSTRLTTSALLAGAAKAAVSPLNLEPNEYRVTAREFDASGVRIYALVNQNTGANRIADSYSGAVDMTITGTVANASHAFYDLTVGTNIPLVGSTLTITVPAAGGKVVAEYANAVTGVTVSASNASLGNSANITVGVNETAGISTATHLISLFVTNALGANTEYSRVMTMSGQQTVTIPIARNDPSGQWSVTARELASSMEGTTTFTAGTPVSVSNLRVSIIRGK